MIVDPQDADRRTLNGLVNALVGPRPVSWVSTVSADGQPNLAPFSFFNAFSFQPPTLGVSPGSRDGVNKDSLRNIRETGEFVVSVVNEELAPWANLSSSELPAEVDEWELLGLGSAPSKTVRPPRVARSPAAFECHVREIVDLGPADRPTNSLVIGAVQRIHVADDVIGDDGLPDLDALGLVGRMSGDDWTRTRDRFQLRRPGAIDAAEVRRRLADLPGTTTPTDGAAA